VLGPDLRRPETLVGDTPADMTWSGNPLSMPTIRPEVASCGAKRTVWHGFELLLQQDAATIRIRVEIWVCRCHSCIFV